MVTPAEAVDAWKAAGRTVTCGGTDVFVLDAPCTAEATGPPILVLHGFPTCSYDWQPVLDRLRQRRRVVLFDFPGFGLSDKPDRRYGIRWWADTAEAVLADVGLTEVALVTHDAGDTVGGELLARDLDGSLQRPVRVVERVVTNGSIYLGLAHLTAGQNLLLSLPDEMLDASADASGSTLMQALAATHSPAHESDQDELAAQWLLLSRAGGDRLLPRTIRYIEDRRADEARFTGAIERHPSPLGVVWGLDDPIAVAAMADKLGEARPDARIVRLDGVGHYPMVEAPDRFATAVLDLFA